MNAAFMSYEELTGSPRAELRNSGKTCSCPATMMWPGMNDFRPG